MTMVKPKIIALGENGRRIGESHHRSRLSDSEVDEIRELREEEGMSYGKLAERLQAPKSTIRDICKYLTRVQVAVRWVRRS